MKKTAVLFLALALLLPCVSCGGEAPEETFAPETSAAETEAPAATKESERVFTGEIPVISHPFRRAELDALPVATADMTEDELREICVRYMAMQQGIVWTPETDWIYEIDYNGKSVHLKRGLRYAGLPYTAAATDLETFLDYYDEETGVLHVGRSGATYNGFVGDTCTTSCFWAWARVTSTFRLRGVKYVNPSYGAVPLGPYTCDPSIDNFANHTTDLIVKDNGEQVMFESYALLKPASGLVSCVNLPGHVRMAMEDAVVVRKADGTIDGEESYVLCIEQTFSEKEEPCEDGVLRTIGKVGKKYTFKTLFDTWYLPFEIQELCGKAEVQKAETHLANGSTALDEIMEDTVVSNYAISRVKAVFRTPGGETAFEAVAHGNAYDHKIGRAMPVKNVFYTGHLLRNLKKGERYSLTLEVRLGSGETFTLDFGEVTYQP